MSDSTPSRTISLATMRRWKSALEQLGAEGDMDLLRAVVAQRDRYEQGDHVNRLTAEQIGLIEGFTGIKAEYEEMAPAGSAAGV
ncbi:MAG: hypothetical protein ACRDJC_18130 [Thermomicrobiales bacterium]